MKTINSKKKSFPKIEIFKDTDTGKCAGFAGKVALYDSEIFIDTRTGEGYEDVIKKLNSLICKFALKFRFNGSTFEDIKQDISILILEGIPKYDPERNMKLSSFLQMRIARRMINELRNKNRSSKNATFLNITTYNITCKCGYSFVETMGKDDSKFCVECGEKVEKVTKKSPINVFEVNESMLAYSDCGGEFEVDTYINVDESIYNIPNAMDNEVIKMLDMKNWLKGEDPRVVKIVELIYFHDYSITAAAKEVGLTGAGANIKLKNLRNNKIVRELFGR